MFSNSRVIAAKNEILTPHLFFKANGDVNNVSDSRIQSKIFRSKCMFCVEVVEVLISTYKNHSSFAALSSTFLQTLNMLSRAQ